MSEAVEQASAIYSRQRSFQQVIIALLVADMHCWGTRITSYHVTKLPGHPPYEGHYFTASADLWDAAVDHSNIPPHSTCQTCVLVAFLKSSYRDSRGRTVSSCFGGLVLLGRSFRIQRVLWHTTSVVALARDVCQSGLQAACCPNSNLGDRRGL